MQLNDKSHMIRVKNDLYKKLINKKAEYINKYDIYYTISEVIEVLLLEANIYEQNN